MRSIATLVLVLSIAGSAAAQPAEPPATAPPPPPEELSESMALGLSLGTTLVAWSALFVTAAFDDGNKVAVPVVGIAVLGAPSLGHWYADSPWTRGLALRTGGLLSLGLAMTQTSSCPAVVGGSCSKNRLGEGLAIAAIALYAAGTVDDIVTVPAAVRRHNARLSGVAVVPMVRRDAGGVMLAAQF